MQPSNLPQQYAAPGPGGTTPAYVPSTAQAAQALEQQNAELKKFWREQMAEIEQVGTDPAEFKNHQLPLARIKKVGCPAVCERSACCATVAAAAAQTWRAHEVSERRQPVVHAMPPVREGESVDIQACSCAQIMKSDEDVRMISAEAPVLFAKVHRACCWTTTCSKRHVSLITLVLLES